MIIIRSIRNKGKKVLIMMAWIDVENAHTNDVITYKVPLIKFEDYKEVIFDISNLTNDDFDVLRIAIDTSKDTSYTDIELFYTDQDKYPNYGPDYKFEIDGNKLVGKYVRPKWLDEKRDRNAKKA